MRGPPLSALRLDADGRAGRAGIAGGRPEADQADEADEAAAGGATQAYWDLLLSEPGDAASSLPRLADSSSAGSVRAAGAAVVEWWPEWAPQL